MKLNTVIFISLFAGFLSIGYPIPHPHQTAGLHPPVSIDQVPKLDSSLSYMVSHIDHAQPESADHVQVTLELSAPVSSNTAVLSTVQRVGGQVQTYAGKQIQALVPINALNDLAVEPSITFIHTPNHPYPDAISEGVELINADNFRLDHNTDGAGVKIAVLDQGFFGYEALQDLGELPEAVTVTFRTSGEFIGTSSHGTACAEIIYDIAPGAEYYFVTYDTDTEFENALDYLENIEVDIVSHSLSFLNLYPYDGTSLVSDRINQARENGIFWVNSAGDYARRHWEGIFPINAGENFVFWDGNSVVINEFQNVVLGDDILVYLSWNDWPETYYDLVLILAYYNGTDWGYVPLETDITQDGNEPPIEKISFPSEGHEKYGLVIYYDQNPPADLYLELYSPTHDLTHYVPESSIPNAGDAAGAFTVGAVSFANYPPTYSSLEPYSSQGPINSLGGGEPDFEDVASIKPDIVAPDGIATESYSEFRGTSASAPHAAGAAALYASYSELYGDMQDPDAIQNYLESCAVYNSEWGTYGDYNKSNVFGAGGLFMCEIPTVIELHRFSASSVTFPWDTILLAVFVTSFSVICLTLFSKRIKRTQDHH